MNLTDNNSKLLLTPPQTITTTTTIKASSNYSSKLIKSFDLILNQTADHRDDTINSKLIDSLSQNINQHELISKFIQEKIFNIDLNDKEPEIAHFFFNLIKITINSSKLENDYKLEVVSFLRQYLELNFNLDNFQIESSVFCSILSLTESIQTQKIDSNDLDLIYNILFSESSLLMFLDPESKSIYVHRQFKKLLIKYLFDKFDSKQSNDLFKFFNQMPDVIRVSNLDLYSNLIKKFDLTQIKKLNEKINLNGSLIDLVNENEIESFTIVNFLINISNGHTLDDILSKNLDYFLTHIVAKLGHDNSRHFIYKKFDLLFKYLIYLKFNIIKFFYMFINKTQLDHMNNEIENLFLSSLSIRLNNHNTNIDKNDSIYNNNYNNRIINVINETKFKYEFKIQFLKCLLFNLKLYMKKFALSNISKWLQFENITYLLRNINLDLNLKNLLIKFLIDYYEQEGLIEQDKIFLSDLANDLIKNFKLKIDNNFNTNIFKLISIAYKLGRDINDCNEYLNQIENDTDYDLIINFITELSIKKVICIKLNYKHFVDKAIFYLFNQIGIDQLDELKNDLKQSSLKFFNSFFDHLLADLNFKPIILNELFSNDLEKKLHKYLLIQSEAFDRRELINLVSKIALYRSITEPNFSTNLLNTINLISYILLNDYDWECQLNCLNFFDQLLKLIKECKIQNDLIFTQTDMFKSFLISLNDYDQHVVNKVCKLLIDLKNDEYFISLITKLKFQFNSNNYIRCLLKEIVNEGSIKEIIGDYDLLNNDYVIDDKDYLKLFLNSIDINYLQLKTNESSQTSDLYTRNPECILDDIISSYQFDWDDEKAVDCY